MSEHTRSRAGIECIKFLSKFYEDNLIVLRNYSEIIDGSFRDIDLFLDVKKSKINDILNSENVVDENHLLISNIRRPAIASPLTNFEAPSIEPKKSDS